MRILLDRGEINKAEDLALSGKVTYGIQTAIVKATGKKILIKLQAIDKIPDLEAFDKRLKEFIKELKEEVNG